MVLLISVVLYCPLLSSIVSDKCQGLSIKIGQMEKTVTEYLYLGIKWDNNFGVHDYRG